MRFYIAVNTVTQGILEVGSTSLELDKAAARDSFKSALSANYGTSDIFIYNIDADTETAKAVLDGSSYSLIWEDGIVTGIDFSPETSKLILKTISSKETVSANSVNNCVLTFQMWKADGSEIDSSVNEEVIIPIVSPEGHLTLKCNFVDGSSSKIFKTTKAGNWIFPSQVKRYKDYRIDNSVIVEATLDLEDF